MNRATDVVERIGSWEGGVREAACAVVDRDGAVHAPVHDRLHVTAAAIQHALCHTLVLIVVPGTSPYVSFTRI